jgi:hypothetical protein
MATENTEFTEELRNSNKTDLKAPSPWTSPGGRGDLYRVSTSSANLVDYTGGRAEAATKIVEQGGRREIFGHGCLLHLCQSPAPMRR